MSAARSESVPPMGFSKHLATAVLVASALGCAIEPGPGDVPIAASESNIDRSRTRLSDDELRAFRRSFQADYVERSEAVRLLATGAPPQCASSQEVLTYVDALITADRAGDAQALATRCRTEAPPSADVLLASSHAAAASRDLGEALRHADAAVDLASGPKAQALAIERAVLAGAAYDFGAKVEIDRAIARGFGAGETATLLSSLVSAALAVEPFELTEEREKKVLELAAVLPPVASALVLNVFGRAAMSVEFRYHDTLRVYGSPLGKAMLQNLPAPSLQGLAVAVHRAVMNHTNDAVGWSEGEILLAQTIRFQRRDQAPFSLGLSPFTYAELRGGPCKGAFAEGADAALLAATQSAFAKGEIAATAALLRIRPLRERAKKMVDVEVFAGSLLESSGDDAAALSAYWIGRVACPYHGRAVSGTSGVVRRLTVRPNPLVPDLTNPPPAAFRSYVTNYRLLSERQRTSVAFGLRFWWPYLGTLSGSGRGLYVQPTYQRLTETPAFEGHPDWASYRYPADGRLLDDLDGVGGATITASFAVLDDFKWGVVVHEAGHQFHALATQPIKGCITRLFEAARDRDSFSVGYAATNEQEYFAVGIQHYAAPEGYVGYGGISKGWYREHDRRLYDFVASIEASRGDMARVTCPN